MSELREASLYGFSREDLDAIASGLESEPATINVGNTTGEGDELLQSTAAAAAKFIRAALSAEPAQEMTDERISDLMGWNVEAMQQNEPEDLPTRVRALVRVAEAEAVAADRASRLPEMGEAERTAAMVRWAATPGIGHPQSFEAGFDAAVEAYKALVRGKT